MPLVSIVLPVRNEAAIISSVIGALRATDSTFLFEVIVVDGQSTDQTACLAQQAGARVIASPRVGRGAQMDLGARSAQGDWLVFLHADTRLPQNWASCIQRVFIRHPTPPAAAAFRLAFDSDRPGYRILAALARLRGRLTGIPHGDQALILSRSLYFAAGGFPNVPLMEEYVFLQSVQRWGRIEILPECVVTSNRRHQRGGPIRVALRNTALIGLFYLGVSPKKLARWYK